MNSNAVIEHISNWLLNYQRQSGLEGFVVGVSGGIDSAVTSTLCARTGVPVLAISMPILQNTTQYNLAQAHLQWLRDRFSNVQTHIQDLTPVFQALCHSLPADIQDGLTMANTRSRLRMQCLYAFAGHHRRLVAGTGNKVEDFGVGFFTKYGDGGVDVSPIADLMKSEVYVLARTLGVIEGIQEAAPTDGLWDDARTDEHQLGVTYADLEDAMRHHEAGGQAEDLTEEKRQAFARYLHFHERNKHKMEPIPVCHIPAALR